MVQLVIALLWFSGPLRAAEVAFIKAYNEKGRLIQLEPGGRFMHVGIRYGDYWIHAHPQTGVELTTTLEKFGHDIVRLANDRIPEPSLVQISYWLGKPFDHGYRWNCQTSTYCSRLVADLLGLDPVPMLFEADVWQHMTQKPIGHPGLSPDDLFAILLQNGYTERDADCPSFLAEDGGPSGNTARVYQ